MAEVDKKDIDIYGYIESEYFYEFNKTGKIDTKVGIALTLYGFIIAYNGSTLKWKDLVSIKTSKPDIILAAIMLIAGLFVIISSFVLIFNLVKVLKFTGYHRVSPAFFEKKIKNETEKELCENIIKCIKENQAITESRLKSLNKTLTWLPFLIILSVILSVLFEFI